MAILVILGLIVLWGVVLVPPILKSRNASGFGGVSSFTDSLRSLGRGPGASRGPAFGGPALGGPVLHGPVGGVPLGPVARPVPGTRLPGGRAPGSGPGGMTPMQRRRRNVLFVLGGATGFFFLVGLVTGSTFVWLLFLLAAAALGGYVYLLLQFKKSAALTAVRPVRPVRAAPVAVADDDARVGDNVVVLRRNVG